MATLPSRDWFHRFASLGGVASGLVVAHAVSALPNLLDLAETDFLHGHPWFLAVVLTVAFAIADPLRARGTVPPLAHGFLFGTSLWWTGHFLLRSDLAARNDITFVVLAVLLGACLLTRAWLASFLIGWTVRLCLRRNPAGHGPLQFLELALFGKLSGSPATHFPTTLVPWMRWHFHARQVLGVGPARCHAVERAFEQVLDRATQTLGKALGVNPRSQDLESLTLEVAQASAAELMMVSLVHRFAPDPDCRRNWPARLAKVWDLIRHAERISDQRLLSARRTFLEAIASCSVLNPWLKRAASLSQSGHLPQGILRQLELHCRSGANGEELLGCAFLVEILVDTRLATWAISLLDGAGMTFCPEWIRPQLARIRWSAEMQMLDHERALEETDAVARRAQISCSILLANAPELAGPRDPLLVPPLRELPSPGGDHGTALLTGLIQSGLDRGPGLTVFAFVITVAAVALTGFAVYRQPLGNPLKPLVQLSGSVRPASHPISAADTTPDGRTVLMATRGGGLHELDSKTFRLRTRVPGKEGPSSSFLSDVAIGATGLTAVATYLVTPGGEDSGAAGLDVKSGAAWNPLIRPNLFQPAAASNLQQVVALGSQKLMREGSRWLLYRESGRELTEISFKGFPAPGAAFVTALAADRSDATRAFAAVRTPGNPGSRDSRIFELRPGNGTEGEAIDVTGSYPTNEAINRMTVSAGKLWVVSDASRLYEISQGHCQMRLDGDIGLNLSRVAHAIVSDGPPAALWIVEQGADGLPSAVRARILANQGVLPAGPWVDLQRALPSNSVRSGFLPDDLLGSSAHPAPTAVYDPDRQQHVLLAPGRAGGIWRLVCPRIAPASREAARLEVEFIETPGERVLGMDRLGSQLTAVLESTNGFSRRLVSLDAAHRLASGLPGATMLLHSLLPDARELNGARILASTEVRSSETLHLFLESGRILTWDLRLHGFTSRSGSLPLDPHDRPVSGLRSVDCVGGRVVLVDRSGRVLVSPETELARNPPRFSILHEGRSARPGPGLDPLRIATLPSGVEVFMGEPGSRTAEPWFLGPTSGSTNQGAGPSRMTWQKASSTEPLRIDTLTRLQIDGTAEDLVGLGTSGSLHWRGPNAWVPADPASGQFTGLINAIGATFARRTNSLHLLGRADGHPSPGQALWSHRPAGLRPPFTAAVAHRAANPRILLGHAGGLSAYSPDNRQWTRLLPSDSPNPSSRWTFLANEDASGSANTVWAIDGTTNSGINRIVRLHADGVAEIPVTPGTMVAAAENALALLDSNGGVYRFDPSGGSNRIAEPMTPEVGDVDLRRIVGTQRLHALDQHGHLLFASADHLYWKPDPVARNSYLDAEIDAAGDLFLVSTEGKVLRPGGEALDALATPTERLLRLGSSLAAATPSKGFLQTIGSGAKPEPIASGWLSGLRLGPKVTSVLTDGDVLYLAGAEGSMIRGLNGLQTTSLLQGAGISRFEDFGRHVVAWKSETPFRVVTDANSHRLEPISGPIQGLVSGPDQELWAVRGEVGIRPVTGAEGGTAWFRREGSLPGDLTEATPWMDDSVLLSDATGSLVRYDQRRRSLSRVGNTPRTPWRFLRTRDSVLIESAVSGGHGRELHLLAGAQAPSLSSIESSAMGVLAQPGSVSWIRVRDRSVHRLESGSTPVALVSFPETPSDSTDTAAVSQILPAADGSLWALAGTTAFNYSLHAQSVARRLTQVKTLGHEGQSPIAVTESRPGQLALWDLSTETPRKLADGERVALSENRWMAWGDRDSRRDVLVGRQPTGRWSAATRAPVLLDRRQSPILIPGTDLTAWLSEKGGVVLYDLANGNWRTFDGTEIGWSHLGLLGNRITAVRPKDNLVEVGQLDPERGFIVQHRIPGHAWFTEQEVFSIQKPSPETRTVARSGSDASSPAVAEWRRLTTPFNPGRSATFESTAMGATLAFLAGSEGAPPATWVVRDADHALPVRGLPFPASLNAQDVFAEDQAFIVRHQGRLSRIPFATAEVQDLAGDVEDVGQIGDQLWFLQTVAPGQGGGWSLRRVADGATALHLHWIESQGQRRRIQQAWFSGHGAAPCLALQLEPTPVANPFLSDAPAAPELPTESTLSIVAGPAGLQVRPMKDSAGVPAGTGSLPARTGDSAGILIRKDRLDADGWVASRFPVAFEPGDAPTNRLPVRMRDGSVLVLPLNLPANPRPTASSGPAIVSGGTLRIGGNDARFGTVPDQGGRFPCDEWVAAIPASDGGFYTADALGQVWRWQVGPGGFRRMRIPLPQGTAGANGFRLPATPDGSVLVVDATTRVIARISDGRVAGADDARSVTTPAERGGQSGPLQWFPSAGTGLPMVVSVSARGATSAESLKLAFTGSGLGIDRPIDLSDVPGESAPWLQLGSLTDGRKILCPAVQDGIQRLSQLRLITPTPPADLRAAFSVAPLTFTPTRTGWSVTIDGAPLAVSRGAFAIDDIRSAATLTRGTTTELYLATSHPGALVVQSWRAGALGKPRLLPVPGPVAELRSWQDEICIQLSDGTWRALRNQQWQLVNPEWSVARGTRSRWGFDLVRSVLSWEGEEVPVRQGPAGSALAPDVLTAELESDGTPRARSAPDGAVLFQSDEGSWYSWKPGYPVNRRTPAPAAQAPELLRINDGSFPRRTPTRGTYTWNSADGSPITLPLTLRAGRMPHQDVIAIESWGADGLLAVLHGGHGFLAFPKRAFEGGQLPSLTVARPAPLLPTPTYANHDGVRLLPDRWMVWRGNGESLQFALRPTRNAGPDSSLGPVMASGFEIDDPEHIHPVAMEGSRLRFIHRDAFWVRELGPGLASFHRLNDPVPTGQVAPVFDEASGRMILGVTTPAASRVNPPWLGRFAADGRRVPSESYSAALSRSDAGKTLQIDRDQPRRFSLRLTRAENGWTTPFEQPSAAFLSGNRLMLVGEHGDCVGYWDDAPIDNAQVDPLPSPLATLWRDGSRILGSGTAGGHAELTLGDQDETRVLPFTPAPSGTFAWQSDTFSLRRNPTDGMLVPVWRHADAPTWKPVEDWQKSGLPGSWIERAAHLGPDALILQDRFGLRRFSPSERTSAPPVLAADGVAFAGLSRHLTAITILTSSDTSASQTKPGLRAIIAGSGEAGFTLAGGTGDTAMTNGSWVLSHDRPGAPLILHARTEAGSLELSGQPNHLSLDVVTGLFDVSGQSWLTSPAGAARLNDDRFLGAHRTEARDLLSQPDLGLTLLDDAPAVFSRSRPTQLLRIAPGFPGGHVADGVAEYTYFQGTNDWILFRRTDGQLALSRNVQTETGPKTDTAIGASIFSGCQMAFDHVAGVHRDPNAPDNLVVVTDRAIERVLAGNGPPTSRVIDIGRTLVRPPPWHISAFATNTEWNLRIDDQSIRIPAGSPSPRAVDPSTSRPAFTLGSRIWLIEPDRIRWLETDPRWKAKRTALELSPTDSR